MSENQLMNNKVILITGGANGVGKAAAIECALRKATVIVADKDEDAGRKVVHRIKTFGGNGEFFEIDLRDVNRIKTLFEKIYNEHGRLDGLFAYAGITPVSPLDTCTEEIYDAVMDTNFKAVFFCCQEAVKYMRLTGSGSIILTGSAHGWGGQKDRAAYACSKGALRILNEHIAHQYASEHIRCNYLTLGWTPTEGELRLRASQGISEKELREEAAGILPMGRMCEPSDYLEAIVYMLSDASSMMTGSIFRVTAGEYI